MLFSMKTLSIWLTIIVGLGSILLFKQQVTDIATYTKSFLLNITHVSVANPEAATEIISDKVPELQTSKLELAPGEHLFATNMSVSRAIRKVFLAIEQAEGAGARVRRSIGTPQLRNFSPFLMLDHFSIKPGAG